MLTKFEATIYYSSHEVLSKRMLYSLISSETFLMSNGVLKFPAKLESSRAEPLVIGQLRLGSCTDWCKSYVLIFSRVSRF